MIRKENLEAMIQAIGYIQSSRKKVFEKKYTQFDCAIKVDFNGSGTINYPEDKGMKITRKTTCNFSQPENFVVLECITRLMDKGYRPEHIELEKEWALGHSDKSGYADILVKDANDKTLFIVECKTPGAEYKKELNNTLNDGGQLFSYWKQEGDCKWLALYSSDFDGKTVSYTVETINCSDDANILTTAKKDTSILLYHNAGTTEDLFTAWDETYDKRLCGDVIFRDDSQAYQIGVKPLRKVDLKDFSENDKVVNKFEEILRHNNVSDKENAFNRLIALFICKLVDEIQKGDNDIVDFQYKVGTDTYETLQDRLQRLHKEGMEKFMREEIFYVADDYAENLVQQYTGQKRQKMIENLRNTLRVLKFYTNNDFAFMDVHNEELFYQNGKILVEVIQLFEKYRIIGSNDVQMLGDLFEQLLNKGFKQNEGQFFTPIPITRFIWDSLPIEKVIKKTNGIEFPKMIDYACGAGHFLTQGFEAVNDRIMTIEPSYSIDPRWAEHKIFGIEKDYRLARVSKISLFMHGAGDGNIIFGDGLENYPDKEIIPESFDILVANPPYSVKSFKPHLKLKNNSFDIINKISNDGSEIETLFVERISQLVKPEGVVAVVLPSSILNKENESFIAARENLLTNFKIKAIAQFGGKTFGETGQNTVILFLEKFSEPPKRLDLVVDSIDAIFQSQDLSDWEDNKILFEYLEKIEVTFEVYSNFVEMKLDIDEWRDDMYFSHYYDSYITSQEYTKKIGQKKFQEQTNTEKKSWINEHFYNYVKRLEREKLIYFALVYQQKTLIIDAPTNNKEQEKFLGYKWSKRKGQEGIQILNPGGKLYNSSNRADQDTLSGLIRATFSGIQYSVPELDDYYYYLRLQDMIDFKSLSFNKSIKTIRARVMKTTPGLINYKLSDASFTLSIGDRVVSNEVDENGSIPIYSANVFEEFGKINKQNITDFSLPSILWGIDGDWMVNMLPANYPFYPTDHCGVLRVVNQNIMPEYVRYALLVAGKHEKFSRSNRASIQKMKNLIIQIPENKNIQKNIVDELNTIEDQIHFLQNELDAIDSEIRKKFNFLFSETSTTIQLGKVCNFINGDRGKNYPSAKDFTAKGIPFINAGHIKGYQIISNDMNYISQERYDLLKSGKVQKGDILYCLRGSIGKHGLVMLDAGAIASSLVILRCNQKKLLPEYLIFALDTDDVLAQLHAADNGSSPPNVSSSSVENYSILFPSLDEQKVFVDFRADKQKEKNVIIEKIAQYQKEEESLLAKYFS